MELQRIETILRFDAGFDCLPGIRKLVGELSQLL
jgi:hypothetical protein